MKTPSQVNHHADPKISTPDPQNNSKYSLLFVMILGLLFYSINFGVPNLFIAKYIETGLFWTSVETGIFQSMQFVVSTIVNLKMGAYMQRFGKPLMITLGMLCMGMGSISLAFPPQISLLIISLFLIGISKGVCFPTLNAFIIDLTTPKQRATTTSLFQSMGGTGKTIGPFIYASSYTLTDETIATPFIFGMISSVFATVISLPLIRWTKSKANKDSTL